jgi:putative transposase
MPSPQAEKIILSDRQQALLKQIVRRTTNPYRLVRRAQLILWAAAGLSNS